MSDLRTILRAADEVRAPDLWAEIQARALAPAPAPPSPPRRLVPRLVPVAAALAAIVAAVVTLVPRPPSAFAIVRDAIEDFASIPPFRATIVGPNAPGLVGPAGSAATLELWYRDAKGWRLELDHLPPPYPQDSVGSYDLWDGKSLFHYDAAANTYSVSSNIGAGFSPLGFLNWDRGGGITFWKERCGREDSKVLGDEEVVGRAARHVRCGELELWIDAETGLMLKIQSNQAPSAGPEPFPGPIGLLPGTSVQITRIEYRPSFPEGIFSFTPPPGARLVETPPEEEQEGEPRPPIIEPGMIAPAWRRPLLTGQELGTDDLRGRPTAVYFWATWCYVCGGDRLDVLQSAFRAYGDRLNVVSVAVNDERGALEDTVARGRYGFPVVIDDEPALGAIGRVWGLRSIPSLVLLDAEGRVVAVVTERGISADELKDYLEAFARGRPLPSADRG
jgi:peroxiredoxin